MLLLASNKYHLEEGIRILTRETGPASVTYLTAPCTRCEQPMKRSGCHTALTKTLVVALHLLVGSSAQAQVRDAPEVFLGFDMRKGFIDYAEPRIAVARSLEEADQIKQQHYDFHGFFPRDKVISCSSLTQTKPRQAWFAVVIFNAHLTEQRKANGTFVCGANTFEDAIQDAYIKATAEAKSLSLEQVSIVAGVSMEVSFESVQNRTNNFIHHWAWYCGMDPGFANVPKLFPASRAQVLEIIKASCAKAKFFNVPAGASATNPPKF